MVPRLWVARKGGGSGRRREEGQDAVQRPGAIVVRFNQKFVPRSVYTQTWLQGGDQLEIVHFIGGG